MSEHVVTIDESNAKQYLIDESMNRLVVVDFWADWCGPCKSLMPILEKLADEYAGDFLLAKVNADEQQMLSAQFGVRSLPTVILMKDGQPVDGFMGAQSEVEVRSVLDKYLPKPWDKALAAARALMAEGQMAEVISPLKEAYAASGERADIGCTLADAYIHTKRLDEAAALLDAVKMVDQDAYYEQVKAQLELALNATKAPEIEALEKQLAEQPNDGEVAFQLAVQYAQHEYHKEALALLFDLLKTDLGAREGEVRRVFNDVLAVLGKGDPLAATYQRQFYALLY